MMRPPGFGVWVWQDDNITNSPAVSSSTTIRGKTLWKAACPKAIQPPHSRCKLAKLCFTAVRYTSNSKDDSKESANTTSYSLARDRMTESSPFMSASLSEKRLSGLSMFKEVVGTPYRRFFD
jgi:hypothetical protein